MHTIASFKLCIELIINVLTIETSLILHSSSIRTERKEDLISENVCQIKLLGTVGEIDGC